MDVNGDLDDFDFDDAWDRYKGWLLMEEPRLLWLDAHKPVVMFHKLGLVSIAETDKGFVIVNLTEKGRHHDE